MRRKQITVLLCFVMIGALLCGCTEHKPDHIYRLAEYLDDDAYNNYMEGDPSAFEKWKDFRDRLADSSEFRFYAYAENMVELLYADVPEECVMNYGTEFEAESRYEIEGENAVCVNAIQVSERWLSLFPVKLCEGRGFGDRDYRYQNAEYIPVILGSAYQAVFALGDTFEGYYILERRTFRVVGFADDSEFYSTASNRMVPCDRYILMPFMEVETDSFAARAILLQQVSGLIETHGSREDAMDIVRRYLEESGLKDRSDDFRFLQNEIPVK